MAWPRKGYWICRSQRIKDYIIQIPSRVIDNVLFTIVHTHIFTRCTLKCECGVLPEFEPESSSWYFWFGCWPTSWCRWSCVIRQNKSWYLVWYHMIRNMIWYDMIWYDMIWCDVMWCDVICDVMWCDVMWCDVMRYDTTPHHTVRDGTGRGGTGRDVVWYGMVWYGTEWDGMGWWDGIWYEIMKLFN